MLTDRWGSKPAPLLGGSVGSRVLIRTAAGLWGSYVRLLLGGSTSTGHSAHPAAADASHFFFALLSVTG